MGINTGKGHSWDSTINQATLSYFVKNTSHCVNCQVSGDNQLAGSADWAESFNDSLGDYSQSIFTECLRLLDWRNHCWKTCNPSWVFFPRNKNKQKSAALSPDSSPAGSRLLLTSESGTAHAHRRAPKELNGISFENERCSQLTPTVFKPKLFGIFVLLYRRQRS